MATRLGLGQYCGTSLFRRQVNGYVVTENRFLPLLSIGLHEHKHPHFTYVLEGGFTETYGQKRLVCEPGTLLMVPAHRAHTDQMGEVGAHTIGVEISPAVAERIGELSGILRNACILNHVSIQRIALRLYREFKCNDSVSSLALESLALDLMVAAARLEPKEDAHEPSWLRKVKDRIHAEYNNPISLGPLAEEAGVLQQHLARAFRRQYGLSVGEYVRSLRLEHAARQLRTTDISIGDISLQAGYYDHAHFCRSFQSRFGLPPSKYRTSVRQVQGVWHVQIQVPGLDVKSVK